MGQLSKKFMVDDFRPVGLSPRSVGEGRVYRKVIVKISRLISTVDLTLLSLFTVQVM